MSAKIIPEDTKNMKPPSKRTAVMMTLTVLMLLVMILTDCKVKVRMTNKDTTYDYSWPKDLSTNLVTVSGYDIPIPQPKTTNK